MELYFGMKVHWIRQLTIKKAMTTYWALLDKKTKSTLKCYWNIFVSWTEFGFREAKSHLWLAIKKIISKQAIKINVIIVQNQINLFFKYFLSELFEMRCCLYSNNKMKWPFIILELCLSEERRIKKFILLIAMRRSFF